MHDQLQVILGDLRSALRFRWFGLGLTVALCLGGWLVVAALPNIYEANARFSLDTTSMLERTLEEQIVATDPVSRLAYIRETLFGRAELEAVARKVGLDAGIAPGIEFERMVDRLGEDIHLDPVATPNTSDLYYHLRYRHTDREMAENVVTAVRDAFYEGAINESQRDEDQALASLEFEIATQEDIVRDHEDALAEFRRATADSPAGNEGAFQQRIRTVELTLNDANRTLNSLKSRREQDLRELERLRRFIPANVSEFAPNSIEAQLLAAKEELRQQSRRLQPTSRIIVDLNEQIAALEEQLRQQREAQGIEGADASLLVLEESRVYQDAQIALANTERDIAEREAEIADLEEEKDSLLKQRDESIANETAQQRLNRAVTDSTAQLNILLESRRTLLRTRAVTTASPTEFRDIETPFAAQTPVKPARLALLGIVFIASLIAGGALCYGMAQLRPIFSNATSLQRFAELPVLGVVTNAWPVHEQTRYRRSVFAFAGACAVLFLALIGVVGIELLVPGGVHAPFDGS